jgi:hypothetical protein
MVLTVIAENGVIGFALLVWVLSAQTGIILRARRVFADDPERSALCLAVLACSAVVLVHAQFDPFWRRGPLWIPWVGTGILLSLLARQKSASVLEAGREGASGARAEAPRRDGKSESFPAATEKF